jgi:tetratricopeptide (TPR) repeat protein
MTEIEKLERRWHENPLGLTFAPLAEAYRKSGHLARALELLDTGLAQHPGYVPAHIVRGRCHLDSGEKALAELDFLCVAELDPENVIALKALADLAEEEGRTSEAIRRLEALLDIDRNNEEAEAQLMRLRAEPALADLPEPLITPRNDSATLTPGAQRLEGIEILDPEAHLPSAGVAALAPLERPALEEPSGSLASLPGELTTWLEESVEVEIRLSEAEPGPATVTAQAELEPLPAAGLEPEPPPAMNPAAATSQPEAESPPAAELEPEPEVEPGPEPVPEPVPQPVPEPVPEPESAAVPASDPPAEAVEPDLVVTETMAEIFLRQGHRELALAVYTQLLQREPGNERIRSRAEELAADLAPPDAPAPPVAPVAGAPEPGRRHDAASTGGVPVREFLATILSAGRPRPSAPVHPPAFEPGSDATGSPGSREPSFDEFFASAGSPASGGPAPEPEPVPDEAAESARAADPDELEQFQAWLRGLKS